MGSIEHWTDAEVEQIKVLFSSGLSASRISLRLGSRRSRSAILGKLSRIGLLKGRVHREESEPKERTPRPPRTRSQPQLPKRVSPHMALAKPWRPLAPEPHRVTILQLSSTTCKWPIGDPGNEDFCFCGHGPRDGSPYCEYHARIAYRPLQERRRGQ